MRQLGKLPTESDARRLAAWLVTQRIDAHSEEEGSVWAVWVRDEDHLDEARAALAHFLANPDDPRYDGVERKAERVLREEQEHRKKQQGNIVQMRGKWGSGPPGVGGAGAPRRCPLVLALIGISVLVAVLTLFDKSPRGISERGELSSSEQVRDALRFVSFEQLIKAGGPVDVWASIQRGQIWRLVTPIFIHFDIMHLVFNMFWLFSLGGQIENRKGSWYMLGLVLLMAVLSNVAQAYEASLFDPRAINFGGMSGVGYGVFGYLLIKVRFDNRDSYYLNPGTVLIGVVWFMLCLARGMTGDNGPFNFMPPVANTAHTVGLIVGMAVAYAPTLFPRSAS
jgi:GlpG protein